MAERDDLYFILNPALGIIKIGISNDVEQRRESLEHASGCWLQVLRVVEGAEDYEQDLHDAFWESRLIGEWFEPSPELLGLATTDAPVHEFVAGHRTMIANHRKARTERKATRMKAAKGAARSYHKALALLKAEARRLKAAAREAHAQCFADHAEAERAAVLVRQERRVSDPAQQPPTVAAAEASGRRRTVVRHVKAEREAVA